MKLFSNLWHFLLYELKNYLLFLFFKLLDIFQIRGGMLSFLNHYLDKIYFNKLEGEKSKFIIFSFSTKFSFLNHYPCNKIYFNKSKINIWRKIKIYVWTPHFRWLECVSHSMASSIFIWKKLIFIYYLKMNWSRHLFFVLFLKGKQNKKEKP